MILPQTMTMKQRMSPMKTYEDSAMFSEDDYEGFSFVQDVTCNMNDNAEDTRQLDPSA